MVFESFDRRIVGIDAGQLKQSINDGYNPWELKQGLPKISQQLDNGSRGLRQASGPIVPACLSVDIGGS
jgi:hypothetical protein